MPHHMWHSIVSSLETRWEYALNLFSKRGHCLQDLAGQIQEASELGFLGLEYPFQYELIIASVLI